MNDWKKPEFVEVRMDAEINCYSSALPESRIRVPNRPVVQESGSENSQE
jgi:coenzyme PQQ precursor peptide PqqA